MNRKQRTPERNEQPLGPVARLRRRRAGQAAAAPFKRRLLVETIEQRVLMDADPLAVATVNGSLDSPGEVDAYTFTLDNTTTVSFDSRTNNGNLRWSLVGPTGTVVNLQGLDDQSSAAAYAPLTLGPGAYRLEIDGAGSTTGAYAFSLLDLSRATTVAINSPVTGQVPDGAQQLAFSFDGQAGDALWLDTTTVPAGVNFRLHDPFGNRVGGVYNSAVELPLLPYNGRYTLIMDGNSSTPAAASYAFQLRRLATPVNDLGALAGSLAVNGNLAAAGDSAVFRFSLAQASSVLLDALTGNDNFRLTLTGPAGLVSTPGGQTVSNLGLNTADLYYQNYGPMALVAGDYTLRVDGSGAATGAFALVLQNLASATAVTRGQATAGQLNPGAEAHLFRINATAGDSIHLDVGSATSTSALSWSLYDPFGTLVTYASSWYDVNSIALGLSGDYTLVVRGDINRTAATDYAFTVVGNGNTPVSLPAGTPITLDTAAINSSIAVAGGTQVWRFTLAEPRTVYFDPLTSAMPYGTYVSLQGPRGTETPGGYRYGGYYNAYWDDGAAAWTLPAGDYALSIRSDSAVPSFAFRLLDLAASATALPTGSTVSGELNPGSSAAFYSFDAAAGEKIYIDGQDSGFANLERRILDPWGREVAGSNLVGGDGNQALVLPYAGRYTLLVEGHNYLSASAQAYRFVLNRPVDKTVPLDIGVAQLPAVAWTQDGSSPAVAFDGAHVATVAADPGLSFAGDVSMQLRFKLDNLDRQWQSLLYKGNNVEDGNQRNYALWVNSSGYLYLSIGTDWGAYALSTANGSIRPDQWYDAVAVVDRNAGKLRLYIDGVLAAESTSALPPTTVPNRTYATPLTIGSAREQWHNNESVLEGAVSEVRVWGKALSAAEVTGLQTTPPTAGANSLALWLKLDEASGTSLADASGNGRNATLSSPYAGLAGVVLGTVDVPGQSVTYTLNLAQARQVFFDSLSPTDDYLVSISGPNTSISERDLAWVDNSYNLLDLPAGEYRITVRGSGQQTGAFAFRLLDAANATAVAYNTPVSGTLNPGDQAHLYRFNGTAGQVLLFDALANTGYGAAQWRLLDPAGRAVFSQTTLADRENLTLAVTGTYTLVVDGYAYEHERQSGYSFMLREVTPQAPVAISLGQSLDNNAQRSAGRTGGGALVVSGTQYAEIAGAATNQSGSFTVETWFKVDQPSTGTWTELAVKTDASGRRQYGVWVNANGQLYAESRDVNGNAYGHYSAAGLVPNSATGAWQHVALVLDRANSQLRVLLNGEVVISGYMSPQASWQGSEPLRLGRNAEGHAGHEGYQVSIDELRIWDSARSTADIAAGMASTLTGSEAGLVALYRFDEASGSALVDSSSAAATGSRMSRLADELPGLVVGRLDQPGGLQTYTLTLAQAKTVYFDNFTHRHDLSWRLTGPTINIGTSFYSGDSNNSYNLLQLPAGTYTFTVDGSGSAVGEYAFRFVDVAAEQQAVALDTVVNTRLDPGAMARVFTFDASAGDRVLLDILSYTGTQPVWRLLDPTGAQVFGLSWVADTDVVTLSRSGTYTLLLEDYTASGAAASERDVSFTVRTVQDQSLPLVLGQNQLRPGTWVAGPDGAGSAVQLGQTNQVRVPPSQALNLTGSFTVEAMVKLDSYDPSGRWMPLVSQASDFNHQTFGIWIGPQGQVNLDSHQAGANNPDYPYDYFWNLGSAVGAVGLGDWHRVSATADRSSGLVTLYVDGAVVAQRSLAYYEKGAATSQPNLALRMGATDLSNTDRGPLLGAVADLRVWNTARSATEVAAAATTPLAGNEPGLVLALPINEGTGNTLAGQGSAGLSGQLINTNSQAGGTVVEGRINAPGQRVLYQLSPSTDTRLMFDTLTAAGGFTWSLLDANGQVVNTVSGQAINNRQLRDSDAANWGTASQILLRGGRSYTLVVDGQGSTTGDFAFRLARFADATPIAFDQGSLSTYTVTVPPAHGSATLESDGRFSYTPAAGYSGQDRIEYTWIDAQGASHSGEAVFRVQADLQPVAVDDLFTTVLQFNGEGYYAAVSGSVASNDTQGNGAPGQHSFRLLSGPEGVSLLLNNDGSFQFESNFSGTFEFTYAVTDADGDESQALLTIQVNDPQINDDLFQGTENLTLFGNVLANDGVFQQPGVTVELVTGPQSGRLVYLGTDGAFDYEPTLGMSGIDGFTYRVLDAQGNELGQAAVTLAVQSSNFTVNDLQARPASFQGIPPGTSGIGSNLRYYVTLPSGPGSSFVLDVPPARGRVDLDPGGSFTYWRDAQDVGVEETITFGYRVDHTVGVDTFSEANTVTIVFEAVAQARLTVAGATASAGLGSPARVTLANGALWMPAQGAVMAETGGSSVLAASAGGLAPQLVQVGFEQSLEFTLDPGTTLSGRLSPVFPPTTDQLLPANSTRLYSFMADAGDQVVLDYLSQSGGNWPYWRLFDEFGNQVHEGYIYSDSPQLTLPRAGRYTLAIEGQIDNLGSTTHQFAVRLLGHVDQPGLPVGTAINFVNGVAAISGTSTAVETPQVYTFTLSEPRRVYVDTLNSAGSSYYHIWNLSGQQGPVAERWSYDTDGPNQRSFYELPAGDYAFTVRTPYSWALGTFGFRLIDLDAVAQPITLGSPVSGTLQPANSAAVFSFAGDADDRYYLNPTTRTNTSNAYWRVLDAQTLGVVAEGYFDNGVEMRVPRDGNYLLSLEGYYGNTAAQANYGFTLLRTSDTTQALSPGSTVNGSVAQPGDTQRYTFSLDQRTRLWLDSFTERTDIVWRVLDSSGQPVFSDRYLADYTNWYDPFELPAGNYTLVVDGSGTATGNFGLRLMNMAAAATVVPGTAQAGTLTPGSETDLYQFDVAAGQRFFFDMVSRSGGQTVHWRLYDPYGQRVWNGTDFQDQDVTQLAYSGRYTLVIEGYPSNTTPQGYSFNIVPVAVQTPVPLSIGLQPAPNLVVNSLQVAGADGSIHSGGTLNLSWSTANTGDRDVTVPFSERVIVTNALGQTVVNTVLGYDPAAAGAIAVGGSVARSASVLLPPGAAGAGALTISVVTDTGNAILEKGSTGETDNSTSTTVNSTLLVYPDLTVSGVGVSPATGLASGQQVTVSWQVNNAGDATPAAGWSDRVLLRNRSTGAVLVDAAVPVPLASAAVAPGSSLARQYVFNWPAGAVGAGEFEVVVTADVDGAVAEYNAADTAEANNSGSAVFTSAPDLQVDGLAVLTAVPVSGGLVDLSWTVRNQGNAATPTGWYDRIIVVNADTGATLANLELFYTPASPLAVGGSASRTAQLRLPEGAGSVGNIRFTVVADQNLAGASGIAETNESNNAAAVTKAAILRTAPNLVVSSFSAPDVHRSGDAANFSWTVRNSGNAATAGSNWFDRLVMSADAVIGNGDDITLATVARDGALGVDGVYTVNTSATVPGGYDGSYRFAVVTDVFNSIVEPDAEADNTSVVRSAVLTAYHADLVVSSPSLPATGVGGQRATVTWQVSNQGDATTNSSNWYDRLWLSPSGDIGSGSGAIMLGDVLRSGTLAAGASYTGSTEVTLPNGVTGSYKLVVQADVYNWVFESRFNDNNTAVSSASMALSEAPAVDLRVQNVAGPEAAQPGQLVNASWELRNAGTGSANAPWTDHLYLSATGSLSGAVYLTSFTHSAALAAAAVTQANIQFWMPDVADGAWQLLVVTDVHNQVFETGSADAETGNTGVDATATVVSHPDVRASDVTVSPGAAAGRASTVQWNARNDGSAAAGPGWLEQVFLSRDDLFDGSDLLLASQTVDSSLSANGVLARSASVNLPADLAAGSWRIIVRSDAGNALRELALGEGNNVSVSAAFAVAEAPLPNLTVGNVAGPATMRAGQPVTVTWNETNTLAEPATGDWSAQVYLSSDAAIGADLLVGTVAFSGTVPGNGTVARSANITLPSTLAPGAWRFVVRTDSANRVTERDELDNVAMAASASTVGAALQLNLVSSVTESAGSTTATLQRNGDLSQPLTVALVSSDTSEATVPATVTIPAGQALVSFSITLPADNLVDGTQVVNIAASASGLQGDSRNLSVVNSDVPALTLASVLAVQENQGTVTMTVSRNTDNSAAELLVRLSSANTGALRVPGTVTIPAGATSVSFQATVLDDLEVWGTREVRVSASADGYQNHAVAVAVTDDELPELTLQFSSTQVSEGAGANAVGVTLRRDRPGTYDLVMFLNSDNLDALTVPTRVVIPAGATEVQFNASPVNNSLSGDGNRAVNVRAIITNPAGARIDQNAVSAAILVTDDDGPTLSVTLSADSVSELGAPVTGTVSRNTGTSGALVVSLSSNDLGEATVPATVTIPDGASSASFTITPVADNVVDGTQAVTIRATASGFSSGAAGLSVTEGDLPDLRVTEIGQPPSGTASTRIEINWTVTNTGLATANGGFRDRVFLSRDDVLSVADRLVAAVIHTTPVPAGQGYTQTASILLPEETGPYRLLVVTDALATVAEGNERNNVGVSSLPLQVNAPVTATVQTAVTTLAVSGEAGQTVVPITGTASNVSTGQPAPNQPIKVMVRVGTVERLLDATTDANGNFSLNFTPLPGEVGLFELGAGFAGNQSFAVQDSFMLIGIEASVPYIRAMGTNETPLDGSFVLKNLTNQPLTGVTATVEGLAGNFDFEVLGLTPSLAGDGSVTVSWRFTPHGVTDTLVASRGALVITTAEGASERLVLDLAAIPQTPKLVATPGFLAQGMLMGRQTLVSFEVFNQGAADTGQVQVQLPDFPWLKLVSPAVIDNIAAGGSATVTVALSPTEDNADLIRYDGSIAVNARLGGLSMPFQFRAVSEATGSMRVSVENQLTYYAEGAPKLAGAVVTLTDPYTFNVVATATTDATGEVFLDGVPEGNYILTVTADKHSSYRATKTISPGTTTDQTVFLDRQLVTYSWNVVPVEIQDRYKIVLESTFETEVPVPVITVDTLKMPVVLPGVTSTINITVSNHGLIQAEDVRINVPIDDLFEIVALTPVIDILPAKSSVEVPITIRVRDGVTPEMLASASLAGGQISPAGWGSAIVKCLGIDTAYKLRCGPDGRWYSEKTDIKPVLCAMDFNEAAAGQLLSYIGDDFNLLDLGCDALDLLLNCTGIVENDCLMAVINAACGAVVGGLTGGPAGAALGALGAASDLLACLCQVFGPITGGSASPSTGGGGDGWGGWGWYPGGGYYSGSGFSYNIQYVNCRGEPVSTVEQQRADEGLLAAVASGATLQTAIAALEAHNEARSAELARLAADGDGILNAEEAGICAQVRIRLEQEAVLTRTAFQGTLEVVNGNTGVPLTGVQLVLDIRDELGNAVPDIFATRGPTLSGLSAVDGTGVLNGGATGSAQYLFIPTLDAAPDAPKRYTIGGTLSYIEGGQKITVPLLAAQITVYPEARLNLHYFQQRDVYADDPFTDVVEPSEAFSLGLLAYNDGKGDARNFSITSAQPKIIENEKGLLIDFKIVGTQVGDQAVAPTLTANLGNIAAGQTQVAQWMMTSTLQGKFIDYTATFEHIDGMGDKRLSLIQSVNIHELIRAVKANAGDAPDFLANDDPDSEHTPDRLYMNNGAQHVVRTLANTRATGTATPGAMSVGLTADAVSGWAYFKIPDPGVGYALDRIVRSDGKVLSLGREVWRTDRSFPESQAGAVREFLLHFIDEDSTGSYTAFYKIDDPVAPRLVEILAVSPDPATSPVDTIDVRFSEAIDLASFTVADLHLALEGGDGSNLLAGASGVVVSQIGNVADNTYRISGLAAATAGNGLFRLTVNATGIADYAGNAGTGVLTETWGMGAIGPYVLSMASGPAARNTALDVVDITFNTALDGASFSADDLRLERDGVVQSLAGVALTLTPLAGNQYRLGGLGAATATPGSYTLTLLGSGLLSSSGAAGLGSQAVAWRMDSAAPQVLNVVDLVDTVRKTVVMALDVELSEPVDITSFDYRDIVLTRTVNGVTTGNLVDARTQIEHLSGNFYRVTGFNWVSGLEGSYNFRVVGAGLSDEAGNAGQGEASQSWVMDFHDPAAATNLAITPDNGSSATDGVSNQLRFTLTGNLAEPGLSVRVSDRTTGNEIGYATVTGTSFSIPVVLDAAGRHELRVRSVDAAGNLADASVVVFVDQVQPTLALPELARDAQGNVSSITLNFSEEIEPASLNLATLSLSRDGGANLLAGATLTRVTGTQYLLSGLAGLTAPAGSYLFRVDMAQVRDLAGNAGTGSGERAFSGALASTGSISGVVYDDIDGTGTRESDELAQGGWTVFDDANGNSLLDVGEASSVTDAIGGRYTLAGLALGSHRIMVLMPSGWTMTPGPVAQVAISAEAPDATHNFGAFSLAGIVGTVYEDADVNGVRGATEALLAGRVLVLDANSNGQADAGEATATTDAQGRYSFSGLAPGVVRLLLLEGDGYVPLQPAQLYAPKSGETITRDLAAVRPGTITGTKYEDLNGNGVRDAGEAGVAGWRIYLDDNGNDTLDAGERSTLTDTDGRFSFSNLLPGGYRLAEVVVTGWVQTAPGTVEAGNGSEQGLDVLLSLPGMVADVEEDLLAAYLASTGMNYDCGCGTFVLEKYTTGQAASHFSKLDTITDPVLSGLTGKGVRVAVIDTGIDTGSEFFGEDADGNGVADRIAFQYDFGDGDTDASDTIGHGTHVAGVIAGQDDQYAGIATEADLVVLKVFDRNSQGYFSTLKRALEWIDANAEAYNIGVVNLSLGDGGNWGEAISRYGMGELFQRLAAKGLVTIAASGNNYFQTGGALGVAYPGADPAVLSVGAMWAGNFGGPWRFSSGATDYTTAFGRIASFTQRDPDQIDVMAPGARFTSAGLNGALATMQGTSQAAAFMSGAAALVQQAAKQLMGRYLTTGEFATLLDLNTYRAVDGDDESDNVANSSGVYNKLDIPKLLRGLKAYAASGAGTGTGGGSTDTPADNPLVAYSARNISLVPGTTLAGQDFGNFKLGDLSGTVLADLNGNGVRDSGEANLALVKVFLDANGNGTLDTGEASADTDAGGSFHFTGVGPGQATVRVLVPAGLEATTPALQTVAMTSGLNLSTLLFGLRTPAVERFDAVADAATVDEDGTVSIDVLANDAITNATGLVLTVDGTGAAQGTVAVTNGQLVYTPGANFHGSDSFSYTITRPGGLSSSATVSVTVNPVNDLPTLGTVADQQVQAGQTLALTLRGQDVDGDLLRYSLLQGPAGATVDETTGALRWLAVASAQPQPFRVQVSDGQGGLAERSFNVLVTAAPVLLAVDDEATLDEDGTIDIDVLANDQATTPAGRSIGLQPGANTHGSLSLVDGRVRYTPEANFHGVASFGYTVSQAGMADTSATVRLVVRPVNDAPSLAPVDTQTVQAGQTLAVQLQGQDIDGDALQYSLLQGPAGATVDEATGALRWLAVASDLPVAFRVRVADGRGGVAEQAFSVNVTPAPRFEARADSATLDEDGSVRVDVLGNDLFSDATGLVLSAGVAGHGTVVLDEGGLRYTPQANFNGSDSFTYTVTRGGQSTSASVTVTVLPVNDAPTLAAVADQEVAEGTLLSLSLLGQDVDGDALQYSLLAGPAGATVDESTGLLRWTATDVTGPQTFRVQVSDGQGGVAERSFQVGVQLGSLRVTSFSQQPWGFALRFNDVVDASRFNLYGDNPDLSVTGARVGAVKGSVVFDADGRGLQWVRTGATLEGDSYTVRLRGDADSLSNSRRGALDGDANGTAGGGWQGSFTAAAVPTVRLRLPDFARGPGQPVLNTGNAGLPVSLVTDGSVSSLSFLLKVDASLMAISEVQRGSELPAGAALSVVAVAGGYQVSITGATLPAGTRQLLNLVGSMAPSVPLGRAGVLAIEGLQLNGVAAPDAADAAVVFVGYAGDMDQSGSYESADVTAIQRLVVRLDSVVPAVANDIDPTVIADVDGNGVVNSRDAAALMQRRSLGATSLIPAIPAPTVQPTSFSVAASEGGTGAGSAGAQAGAGTASAASPTGQTGTALNLAGQLANFALPKAGSASAGLVGGLGSGNGALGSLGGAGANSASLPVSLKVVASVTSSGAADGTGSAA